MPAPAVIPAPIAYIKIVAVKKLVVELLVWRARPVAATQCVPLCACHLLAFGCALHWDCIWVSRSFTLKKLECLKQACAMNTLAWNNNLGLLFYFVGF